MADILLIEDNADNATLVQRLLEAQGYRLRWSPTAEDGLAQAEQRSPDLILLDLGLPDIDGQTLVGYLRRLPGVERVPIIAVTAWPVETARQMVTAYGCDGYFSKPIDVRAFIQTVNGFLGG